MPRYYGGPPTDPPNRLVYLLDHEYTPRGLNWRRLKGADASRVALLRTAAGKAGCEWTAELLRTWFGGDQPAWAYGGGQERPRWVADWLPGLCEGLHATGSAGRVAAQRLVDLAWEWIGKDIGTGLTSSSPGYRDKKLGDLGKPLASVLTAAAAIGAASTRDTVSGYTGNRRVR